MAKEQGTINSEGKESFQIPGRGIRMSVCWATFNWPSLRWDYREGTENVAKGSSEQEALSPEGVSQKNSAPESEEITASEQRVDDFFIKRAHNF